MGLLVDGKWTDQWYDTKSTCGKFVRQDSRFRNWVTADGSRGPTGEDGFAAETGRYHLYVSLACPWAHRTLIFRKLKNLEDAISVSIVDPLMLEDGWTFANPEPINNATRMWQVYTAADPAYTGRVTVPVLWDKKRGTIVSNESADIIRMFNEAFDGLAAGSNNTIGNPGEDYFPKALHGEINEINELVYSAINNGVYKTGFATTQDAYEEAFNALFAALDALEERLSRQRYLVGDRLTEADWRLFTTLVRFDAVYVGHFKCNLRRIADYPNLSNYLRELYQVPGVAGTVDMNHIKQHYYESHKTINPTGIVPAGPDLDFMASHDRTRLAA